MTQMEKINGFEDLEDFLGSSKISKSDKIEKIKEVADEQKSRISDAIDTLCSCKFKRKWSGYLAIEVYENDLLVGITEDDISQFPSSNSWTENHVTIADLKDFETEDDIDTPWMVTEAEEIYDAMVQAKIDEVSAE